MANDLREEILLTGKMLIQSAPSHTCFFDYVVDACTTVAATRERPSGALEARAARDV